MATKKGGVAVKNEARGKENVSAPKKTPVQKVEDLQRAEALEKKAFVPVEGCKRVLFVTAEAMPYLRSGGLGDVAGALPQALGEVGIDCRVVMPLYSLIPDHYRKEMRYVGKTFVTLGWRSQYVGVFEAEHNGIKYYFIDNEYYFRRHSMYGQPDDGERFAYFCKAVLEVLTFLDFQPQVIHCNDWHTGLLPVFLDVFYRGNPRLADVKTVYTIHNIQFQGNYGMELASDVCGLPPEARSLVEYGGRLNMMKGAIESANVVTTVSETYAKELQDPFYAYGLESILRERAYKMVGIINGIDTALYDPTTDASVFVPFDVDHLEARAQNKARLCELLHLNYRADRPLLAMVTRLTTQKGLDLVVSVAEELLSGDLQLVILGTGEWRYESALKDLEHRYGAKLRVIINFSSDLAGKLYAGSDIFLMPSRFEPCGLSQMIAMRYGSLPVVRETGGLKDSVKAYNPMTGKGTGFTFYAYDPQEMMAAIWRAVDTYYNNPVAWRSLMEQAMRCDFSWTQSADRYRELYDTLVLPVHV
ncbi:MAG: glycogen synthase GlgA [Clostridia bacterium]|nr:glycogen synthase GlgA [Clostridia bacterium]